MNSPESFNADIKRLSLGAAIAAAVGLAAVAAGVLLDGPAQFFQSYLQGYLYWLAVPSGCLFLLMINQIVIGEWAHVTRRISEAAVRTLPLMAVLFIPIVLGMGHLYDAWLNPSGYYEEVISGKNLYLNKNGFLIRAFIYFALWIGMGTALVAWSRRQDETGDSTLSIPMRRLSAIGIVVFILSTTAASWDWTMSLEPQWFSSLWGPMFFIAQGLAAFIFVVLVLSRIVRYEPLASTVKPAHFHNLGNFVFAFVILWMYMNFSQFIIIWSGNIPEETIWYHQRMSTGWKALAVFLTLFHFFIPFLVLLSRYSKLRHRFLARVVGVLFVLRFADYYWIVGPSFHETLNIRLLDVAIPVALGGLFMFAFLRNLRGPSLLALHDPRFNEADVPLNPAVDHG